MPQEKGVDKSYLIGYLEGRLQDYEMPSEVTDGYEFDLKGTINKIELYRASKFKSGEYDAQGNKKFFMNISNPQCGNATKNLDLDRKDIRCRATDGNNYVKSLIYNSELKYWMRKNKTNVLLNKIAENLPIYGSVILKKEGQTVRFVPLRNIIIEPGVSNQDLSFDIQSPYIIEKHNLQPDEVEKMAKGDGWIVDEVNGAVSSFRKYREKNGSADMIVYEVYGEFKNSVLGLGSRGYSKAKIFMSCGGYDPKKKEFAYSGILFVKKIDKFPYKKLDYLTIEGRALGLGVIEMLFDPQQRWNEIANQRAVSMKLASRHVYQTRDAQVEKNLMTDILDGDIIKVNSEITPVDTSERNLAAYNQEEQSLMGVVRSLANAFETMTGESLPSGTPYRLGVMLNENGGKLFEFIRENCGNFLEEVFIDWIIPDFEKTITEKHIFELLDQEAIEYIVEKDVNRRVNDAIKKYVINTGYFPPQEDIDIIKQAETGNNKTLFIEIVKGYLDFDYDLEINITGESVNIANRVETISNLLQLLAQNPQIAELPQTKKLFQRLLDDVGFSGADIGKGQMPALNQVNPGAAAGMVGNVPLAK